MQRVGACRVDGFVLEDNLGVVLVKQLELDFELEQ